MTSSIADGLNNCLPDVINVSPISDPNQKTIQLLTLTFLSSRQSRSSLFVRLRRKAKRKASRENHFLLWQCVSLYITSKESEKCVYRRVGHGEIKMFELRLGVCLVVIYIWSSISFFSVIATCDAREHFASCKQWPHWPAL